MTTTNDFDFLIGTWDVANRRLTAPLTGSADWAEFPATAICHGTLFDGAANLDEITFHTLGFSGLTLRLFDTERKEWTLNWVNSGQGRLTPPMTGRFDDVSGETRRGEFFGDDVHDGTPIRCRYVWTVRGASSARWEQAFSADDGETWETNWTMDLTRRRDDESAP